MDAYRKIAKTIVPDDVENAIYIMNLEKKHYARHIRRIAAWSKALNMINQHYYNVQNATKTW